jgi:hypothetical protein
LFEFVDFTEAALAVVWISFGGEGGKVFSGFVAAIAVIIQR